MFFKYGQIGQLHRDYFSKIASRANKVPIAAAPAPIPKGAIFASGPDISQSHLYALTTCQEFEVSLDVITGILKLFSHDMYCLLNPRSALSYLTPFIVIYFGFGPACILHPFFVSIPVGDSVVTKRVYR